MFVLLVQCVDCVPFIFSAAIDANIVGFEGEEGFDDN
jgi:hypothetical protein